MKKCPYCHTFMNDDVNVCPNCLKDMSNLKSMPDVAPKENKGSYYTGVFGIVIALGSVMASLSQRSNRLNYESQYETICAEIEAETDASAKADLVTRANQFLTNIKTCQFREVFFYITCGLGVALMIYALVRFLLNKRKK